MRDLLRRIERGTQNHSCLQDLEAFSPTADNSLVARNVLLRCCECENLFLEINTFIWPAAALLWSQRAASALPVRSEVLLASSHSSSGGAMHSSSSVPQQSAPGSSSSAYGVFAGGLIGLSLGESSADTDAEAAAGIFLRGIPTTTTREELRATFEGYGNVVSVTIVPRRTHETFTAYVDFDNEEAAQQVGRDDLLNCPLFAVDLLLQHLAADKLCYRLVLSCLCCCLHVSLPHVLCSTYPAGVPLQLGGVNVLVLPKVPKPQRQNKGPSAGAQHLLLLCSCALCWSVCKTSLL